MTYDEFKPIINRLKGAGMEYPKEINHREWFRSFAGIQAIVLRKAIDRIIDNQDNFPTKRQVLMACSGVSTSTMGNVNPNCEYCLGEGFLGYITHSNPMGVFKYCCCRFGTHQKKPIVHIITPENGEQLRVVLTNEAASVMVKSGQYEILLKIDGELVFKKFTGGEI